VITVLKKETKKRLRGHWGYYGLLVIILVFSFAGPSATATITVLVLGVIELLFFFFQARMPCGVKNRDEGFCRNRGYGFLGGCTRVEAHRWMKIAALFNRATYSVSPGTILSKFNGKAAAISSGATVVIMAMSVLTFSIGGTTR